jgi:diguanylate cyclase (GGDEF)-like protein
MREVCRDCDFAARVGGDEFVIVAPGMTADSVHERSIVMNALAEKSGREICGSNLLSLSLGAAFYPQDGAGAEQLLAEADKKMYAAKRFHQELREQPLPSGLTEHPHSAMVN